MMHTLTLPAALVLLVAVSCPSSAAPLAPSGLRSETPIASEGVLVRRCPHGYRRTLGGCVRKRPSWWSALLGR